MTVVDQTDEDLFYRTSGAAPPFGTTFAAAAAWVAIALLAAVYAYADLYIQVADIVTIFIVIAFAAAAGFLVFFVLKAARVRNFFVTAIVSCSSAILAIYASWVVWEYALLAREDVEPNIAVIFKDPQGVWEFAQAINTTGTFTMNDKAVKGTELWFFWAGEALLIVGAVTVIPILMFRDQTFCEPCNRWCPKAEPIMRIADGDDATLRQRMVARDFAYLTTLGPATSQTPQHLLVDLRKCRTCEESNFLTVSRITITINNKGQPQTKTKKIVDRLRLTTDEVFAVRALAAPVSAPGPAAEVAEQST